MTARDSEPDLNALPSLDPGEEQRLAAALHYAVEPAELDPELHERLLNTALEASLGRSRRAKVVSLQFGFVSAAVAAAAAVLLWIAAPEHSPAPPDLQTLVLVQSRTTAPLFQSAQATLPSTRIDRIASVREHELRENRYALWGVR